MLLFVLVVVSLSHAFEKESLSAETGVKLKSESECILCSYR